MATSDVLKVGKKYPLLLRDTVVMKKPDDFSFTNYFKSAVLVILQYELMCIKFQQA